jgi:DUF4097 and DUF4098 domain-containing protein YvlB
MKAPRLLLCAGLVLAGLPFLRAADSDVFRSEHGDLAGGVHKIHIRNPLGNVTVKAVADGFGWEWALRSSGGDTTALAAEAKDWRLDVRQTADSFDAVVVRPPRTDDHSEHRAMHELLSLITFGAVRSGNQSLHSDLVLRVPAASAVDLANRFGAVVVEGTRDTVDVDNRNGPVDLKDLPGGVNARTAFGTLHAEKLGPARLTGQNGRVEVAGVAGDLQAITSFGPLVARDVKGTVQLKNQNGGITGTHISGEVDATTSFGNVRLEQIGGRTLVKSQNGRVELLNISGPVTATNSFGSLIAHDVTADTELRNQNGTIEAVRITGALTAGTTFGNLRVEDVGGAADLDCRNGRIEASRVKGDVRAVTSFAPLRVTDIGGAAELRGQNGDIYATAVSGDIHAETSFGRIQLDGRGRQFVAHSQNGGVDIIARSADVHRIDADASFGSINLRLPQQTKPLIRASTSFGKVQSDFPVLMGDSGDGKVSGDPAALKINLKGSNGDIRIQEFASR